jgi:hypothetical protein
MSLSREQVETIKEFVTQNRVTMPTLKDDVVDHLCCEVEVFMANGKSFESSLRQAVYELAPHGLSFIQQQTYFLLDRKIMLNMRKLTFIIGSVSAMSMSFGWLLKILRMPEVGNPFFAIGSSAFLLLFLPMLAVNYYRSSQKPLFQKVKMTFGILSAVIIGMAFLWKFCTCQAQMNCYGRAESFSPSRFCQHCSMRFTKIQCTLSVNRIESNKIWNLRGNK